MKVELASPIDQRHDSAEPIGIERHGAYFWDLVTFKVENQLFRVPKHPFVLGSPTFSVQHGLLACTKGGSDTTAPFDVGPNDTFKGEPITLDGVTVADFETLLQLMFPSSIVQEGISASTKLSTEQWLAILKLSTNWTFIDYRKMAIAQLGIHISDPIQLVKLARQYSVTKWLTSAYKTLITREEPMTEQMGDELGALVAFKLCLLREKNAGAEELCTPRPASPAQSFFGLSSSSPPSRPQPPREDITPRIRTSFKEELAGLAELEQVFRTKKEREEAEAARLAQEAKEEEARVERDEAAKREKIRLEVEEAKVKLAAEEEAHQRREAQLRSQRQELADKVARLDGPTQTKPKETAVEIPSKSSKSAVKSNRRAY